MPLLQNSDVDEFDGSLSKDESSIVRALVNERPFRILKESDVDEGSFEKRYRFVKDADGKRRILGVGSYGEVALVCRRESRLHSTKDESKEYAVKRMPKVETLSGYRTVLGCVRYIRYVRNEVRVLKAMSELSDKPGHEYVAKVVDVFESDDLVVIVMENYTGGDIFHHLSEFEMNESSVSRVAFQIAAALRFIHEDCSAVHCDLKPENVMFSDESHNSLRVIDFGMSRVVKPGELLSDPCGSAYYTAPEVINTRSRKAAYTQPCDIWALGCIVYVLLFGYPPFAVDSRQYRDGHELRMAIYSKILRGFRPKVRKQSTAGFGPWFLDTYPCSNEARSFISQCLISDPLQRPSAQQLLQHPWLSEHYRLIKPSTVIEIEDSLFRTKSEELGMVTPSLHDSQTSIALEHCLAEAGIITEFDADDQVGAQVSDSLDFSPSTSSGSKKSIRTKKTSSRSSVVKKIGKRVSKREEAKTTIILALREFKRQRFDFRELVAHVAEKDVQSQHEYLFDCLKDLFQEMMMLTTKQQSEIEDDDDCEDDDDGKSGAVADLFAAATGGRSTSSSMKKGRKQKKKKKALSSSKKRSSKKKTKKGGITATSSSSASKGSSISSSSSKKKKKSRIRKLTLTSIVGSGADTAGASLSSDDSSEEVDFFAFSAVIRNITLRVSIDECRNIWKQLTMADIFEQSKELSMSVRRTPRRMGSLRFVGSSLSSSAMCETPSTTTIADDGVDSSSDIKTMRNTIRLSDLSSALVMYLLSDTEEKQWLLKLAESAKSSSDIGKSVSSFAGAASDFGRSLSSPRLPAKSGRGIPVSIPMISAVGSSAAPSATPSTATTTTTTTPTTKRSTSLRRKWTKTMSLFSTGNTGPTLKTHTSDSPLRPMDSLSRGTVSGSGGSSSLVGAGKSSCLAGSAEMIDVKALIKAVKAVPKGSGVSGMDKHAWKAMLRELCLGHGGSEERSVVGLDEFFIVNQSSVADSLFGDLLH